jgi:hypothetical protein
LGNKGGGALMSTEENKALVLRLFDLFIGGANPKAAGE